jgi:hypothetical protein
VHRTTLSRNSEYFSSNRKYGCKILASQSCGSKVYYFYLQHRRISRARYQHEDGLGVPTKRRFILSVLHGAISQNVVLFRRDPLCYERYLTRKSASSVPRYGGTGYFPKRLLMVFEEEKSAISPASSPEAVFFN